MSKFSRFSTTKEDVMSDDSTLSVNNQSGDSAAPQAPQPLSLPFTFDDSKVTAIYANFCRVTGTPEELIIDFGLNPQPIASPTQTIVVNDRIVMNFYTAKRMLIALQTTIMRHEQVFGVLEVDVQKRVRNQ